jgi:hypothetical protein
MADRIETYLATLDAALRGPGAAKRELLAEARDHLSDAAEAYERRGDDRASAERRAVRDFGSLAEVAPGYQVELGMAQARRTALLVIGSLMIQPVVWGVAWEAVGGATEPGLPGTAVEWLGAGTVAAAFLLVAAVGIGVRHLGARVEMVRAAGVFGLAIAGAFTLLGAGLMGASLPTVPLPIPAAIGWLVAFLLVPMGVVARWSRDCLVAAEPPRIA